MLTGAVDAKEGRDVMTNDVPNAFIQAHMPEIKDGEDRVVMKISGLLVKLLCELAPETYAPYVVLENGKKVLYLLVLRAIYGMLQAALIWYNPREIFLTYRRPNTDRNDGRIVTG